ncbi:hypothetical protein DBB_48790 [Desulfoluna spongiiphila]|nr:hypothetical protein DBB_48790 [Desulfoluna spongiiphila]
MTQLNLEQYFCPNEQCKEYGLRGHGNIAVRGKYGKEKNRTLLYCRTCGKRFAATRPAHCLVCIYNPRRSDR